MNQPKLPHPKNYKIGIPNMLYRIYTDMRVNDEDTVIDTNVFKEKEEAIEVIKDFMTRGALVFLCFNRDYSKLIISKDVKSEEYIKSKAKAKEETEG